jgi:hypothetical protein
VTAALPLRVSLSLDQVDATVVDHVVSSVAGKIYAVESPDSAEAIPNPRGRRLYAPGACVPGCPKASQTRPATLRQGSVAGGASVYLRIYRPHESCQGASCRKQQRRLAARAVSERAEALEILARYDADQDA